MEHWICLRCKYKNKFREATKKEAEKSSQCIKRNPYSKNLPTNLKDVWCDNCKAHNTLINNKPVTCSGGKIFYKKQKETVGGSR